MLLYILSYATTPYRIDSDPIFGVVAISQSLELIKDIATNETDYDHDIPFWIHKDQWVVIEKGGEEYLEAVYKEYTVRITNLKTLV